MDRVPFVNSQRDRDRAVIMNVVRNFGPVSRVEIHRLTKLRTSTISLLTKELIDEGRITAAGLSDNPTGRKQVLLKLREEQGFVLAFEFDADNVVAAVLDLRPGIRALIREKTNSSDGTTGVLEQLKACGRTALEQANVRRDQLLGIGVGDVGLVNRKTRVSVMTSQFEFWRNVPIGNVLEREFGAVVELENATRCRGNAERMLGSGASSDDMIYVEYGAGIGAAIVTGGRLLEGVRTSAGEFGHTRVVEHGPPCQCGSFGCVEAVASATALAARFRAVYREGSHSRAVELAGGDPNKVTGWHVMAASREGDKISSAIVEEMARHLGIGLANMVNLLDPALIVLDQRLSVCGTGFLDQLMRTIRLQALSHLTADLEIRFGTLGDEAGVLGAALLVVEQLFAIPDLKPPRFMIETV